MAVIVLVGSLLAEELDLPGLAERTRPSVMLLIVSDTQGKPFGSGSGFILSTDGLLATNYHVVQGAGSIVARAENGGIFLVEGIVTTDQNHDLAILKLKAQNLPALLLGSTTSLKSGSKIAVIGSPLGLEGTLSDGIVSATRESADHYRLLQITAPISPGSSGSPVINSTGEVVGIATMTLVRGQSLNFAIAVEHLKKLLATAPDQAHPFTDVPQPHDADIDSGVADRAKAPLSIAQQYFICLNRRDATAAYDLLSSDFRARVPFAKYTKTFASTLSLRLFEARVISIGGRDASVSVSFDEIDAEAGRIRWRGPIDFVLEPSGWRISTMKGLKKSSNKQ